MRHYFIISKKKALCITVRIQQTSLTPTLFIEMPVPSQESERPCISVTRLYFASERYFYWLLELVCSIYVLFLFVLCLVCQMLPVSLGYPFVIAPSVFFLIYFPVSCVPNVASISGVSILDFPVGFFFSLFFLCFVCPMLPVSLGCPFLIVPSAFSNDFLSFVLCVQCCQCLWGVHY